MSSLPCALCNHARDQLTKLFLRSILEVHVGIYLFSQRTALELNAEENKINVEINFSTSNLLENVPEKFTGMI